MDNKSLVLESIKLKRILPANIRPEDQILFEKLNNAEVKAIFKYSIKKANLVTQGILFKHLKWFNEIQLENDSGFVLPYSIKDLLKIRFFWKKETIPDTQVLLIYNPYSHTYYHWLLESLPRLFLLKDHLQTSTLVLPENYNTSFHKETLKIFNVSKIKYLQANTRYVTSSLITCSQPGRIANYNPVLLSDTVRFIKERIKPVFSSVDRIYISRSKASKRKILNEELVETLLVEKGFMVVNMEDFSFSNQVDMMSSCKYLVSIHGAGLANMIFMPKGSSVLELKMFDAGLNYFYYTLACTTDLNYFYQFCQSTDQHKSVQDADIIVDMEEFKLNIAKMLNR